MLYSSIKLHKRIIFYIYLIYFLKTLLFFVTNEEDDAISNICSELNCRTNIISVNY